MLRLCNERLQVEANRLMVIMGSSGAGKTTLVRACLLCIQAVDAAADPALQLLLRRPQR